MKIQNPKSKIQNSRQGFAIVTVLIIMAILLLLGTGILTSVLFDLKISKSQKIATKTYYLAEAGINEAVWKLENDTSFNDPTQDDSFEKNPNWTASFSRDFNGSSYNVTIQNSALARGEIVSIAKEDLSLGKTAQRIVKATVFKALASPTEDSALFSGGASENIEIDYTRMRIYDGNLSSNHNLDIKGGSTVEVYDNPDTPPILEGQVLAVGNLAVKNSTLDNCEVKCTKNVCEQCLHHIRNKKCKKCPPDSISTPLVGFGPEENPDSFKGRALAAQNAGQCSVLCNGVQCDNRCIYPTKDFEDLLREVGENGTLTLNNDITYVEGSIELRGGRRLVVNGALVADDNIKIGERYCWGKGKKKQCGLSQITVNRPTATTPSGLLTKRKINFGPYSSFQDISVTGVIYANDEIRQVSIPSSFNVRGGIIARKLAFTSLWQWLNITLDNEIILYGLGYKIDDRVVVPIYSPIITIEHWEETY